MISYIVKHKILDFLKKYELLNKKEVFLIGFSGGTDSLCLLDVLTGLSKEYEFKLVAAHLNHNWRPEESKLEEERAALYCKDKKIDFCSEILPNNLPHTELEARNQRYDFFNRIAKKTSATAIFTGHTSSDNVETLLYRIIKGTGLSGLRGIPEIRHQYGYTSIYRPLLTLSREETLEYCRENDLVYNVDSSNFNENYLRNKIRLSLIPELKEYNPEVEKAVLRLASISIDSESILEEYLALINIEIYYNDEIITHKFLKLSIPVQKRVIIDLLAKNNIEFCFDRIEQIFGFILENSSLKSGNTLSVAKDLWLFVSSGVIKLISSIKSDVIKSSIMIDFSQDNEIYHSELGKTLKIAIWKGDKPDKFPSDTSRTALVDMALIKEPVYLRSRLPGDRIQPLGMQGSTKLKKYLINKGIPEYLRGSIPVLAIDSEILWVAGVGMSELLRVKTKPSHILHLTSSTF